MCCYQAIVELVPKLCHRVEIVAGVVTTARGPMVANLHSRVQLTRPPITTDSGSLCNGRNQTHNAAQPVGPLLTGALVVQPRRHVQHLQVDFSSTHPKQDYHLLKLNSGADLGRKCKVVAEPLQMDAKGVRQLSHLAESESSDI